MKGNRKAVALLLFVLSISDVAWAENTDLQLVTISQSSYWKRLLHFRGSQSEADGQDFFFSPEGKRNSLAELKASLEAFKTPAATQVGFFKQHPQCAFPERFRFLKEELKFDVGVQPCGEFNAWKEKLKPQSVSLVYATPYLGDAASLFGHSFLKFNSAKSALLDHAVSFDAAVPETGQWNYVFKGLSGGYPGHFSLQPYYLKIKNYSHLEERDLWEYELNLTSEQIDRLLNHLWELTNTYFDYYFLDENCSYHLLSLLEIARPDWNLREPFYLKTIPLDSVRVLTEQNGSVREVYFRAAAFKLLEAHFERLRPEEKKLFLKFKSEPYALTGNESVELLDALVDFETLKLAKLKKTAAEDSDRFNELVQLRVQKIMEVSQALIHLEEQKTPPARPETGHASSKVGLSVHSLEEGSALGFYFRPALHDFLEMDRGYLPLTTLNLGELQLRYRSDLEQAVVKKLVVAEALSLSPLNGFEKQTSWTLSGQIFSLDELGCGNCVAGQLRAGGGGGYSFFNKSGFLFSLIKVQLEFSKSFEEFYQQSLRYGPSIEIGWIQNISSTMKAHLSAEQFWYFPGPAGSLGQFQKYLAAVSYNILPFEVRLGGETYKLRNQYISEGNLSFSYYYE